MAEPERADWFVGDLDDPWVAAIAARLPDHFIKRSCLAEIPEPWIAEESPGVVVLHRNILTPLDIQQVSRLRARGDSATKIALCLGPHARYDDVVRWSRFFEAILPEATAVETIGRWITLRVDRPDIARPLVEVVSGLHDVQSLLADVCLSAGYLVERLDNFAQMRGNSLAICDIPVLESDWAKRLAIKASASKVIALLGFADRVTVTLAREAGARACLEWPCDLDDIIHVLDRVASERPIGVVLGEPAHILPPGPHVQRRQSSPKSQQGRPKT